MNGGKFLSILLPVIIILNVFFIQNVIACKDIIASGDATEGDYNLLMKVRDPSRDGLQVLCIVPQGYEYKYNHPWTGKSLDFITLHKYIGVATKDDVIPNIVKAGMTLTDQGLAFGDADTNSKWNNPTRYAWDDFDWIRYACEKAEDEEEAVSFLTKEAVNELHASGVSENLLIVGPSTGYVVEGDAFHYEVNEIENALYVVSNYPKDLWRTQIHQKLPLASSYEEVKESYVKRGRVLRLNSLYGIRVLDVKKQSIIVRHTPLFKIRHKSIIPMLDKFEIELGERKNVHEFSVELLEIDGNKAKIRLCTKYKAWEDKLMNIIESDYGSLNPKEMFNLSRLHKEDLDGLRPMCEDLVRYEAVAIYKIPKNNFKILSIGWFSPNHACSSIYVPFHVCINDIYDPYENGDAAQLSLDLLTAYGHDYLDNNFSETEDVFLNEIEEIEKITIEQFLNNSIDASDFLTVIDMGIQRQAYYTEEVWMIASKIAHNQEIREIISKIWNESYSVSLNKMKTAVSDLKEIPRTDSIRNKIADIALDITWTRIEAANILGKEINSPKEKYQNGNQLIQQGEYDQGFNSIQKAFIEADMLLKGEPYEPTQKTKKEKESNIFVYILLIIVIIIGYFVLFKKK